MTDEKAPPERHRSGLSEIYDLEIKLAEATTEKEACNRYEVLISKTKTFIEGRDVPEDTAKMVQIANKYKNVTLELPETRPTVVNGREHYQINCGHKMQMPPIEMYQFAFAEMVEYAYHRLKMSREAEYAELKQIISDEFKIHEILHDRNETPGRVYQRIQSRRDAQR